MPDTHGRLTHEERLTLIYKPLPVLQYHAAMPWAGTITGDKFFGSDGGQRTHARNISSRDDDARLYPERD